MKPSIYRVAVEAPTFNMALYGDPGSGKTTLASTAQDVPEMQNVLFANIEGGLLSVAHRGDLQALDIHRTDEVEELLFMLAQGSLKDVRTVVLDSVTELQTLNLEEITAAALLKARGKGDKRERDEIWQDDYGKSTVQLKRLIRGFKDLPANFIVTALAKYVYRKSDSSSGPVEGAEPQIVLPSLTQKLCVSMMGYMDMVWFTYYDADDQKFKALTRNQGAWRAKTRGPKFSEAIGPLMLSPNLPDIYRIFVESERSSPAPVVVTT
jgi:hypothetical protein